MGGGWQERVKRTDTGVWTAWRQPSLQWVAKTACTYNAWHKFPSFLPTTAGQDDKSLDRLKRDDRDVVCIAWLLQCERDGRLVPLRPRHYLHMSRASLVSGLLRGNSNREVAGQGRAEVAGHAGQASLQSAVGSLVLRLCNLVFHCRSATPTWTAWETRT